MRGVLEVARKLCVFVAALAVCLLGIVLPLAFAALMDAALTR